jgi:hypothetical protein
MDRFLEHWPEKLGKIERPNDGVDFWDQRHKDYDRTGHFQTPEGVRIYPENYVVLSEVDVQRIAKATAKMLRKELLGEVGK